MYEAGRDGFWFARWLNGTGIQCLGVDPCCILVDRRAKHRKNDAIDARALLGLAGRPFDDVGKQIRYEIRIKSGGWQELQPVGRSVPHAVNSKSVSMWKDS